MRVRPDRLHFQDGSVVDVLVMERMFCGGPTAWGTDCWQPYVNIAPTGELLPRSLTGYQSSRTIGLDRAEGYAVGRAISLTTACGRFESSPIIKVSNPELMVDAPHVDRYRELMYAFSQAVRRPDLRTAADLQLEAFRVIRTPDWVRWRAFFVDARGRDLPFLHAQGKRVAALYWSPERRDRTAAALDAAADPKAFTLDQVLYLAEGVEIVRQLIDGTDRVEFSVLSRKLAAQGIRHAKTIVNMLAENRELHLRGRLVVVGSDPELPPAASVVPPLQNSVPELGYLDVDQRRFYDEVAVPAFKSLQRVDLDGNDAYGLVYLCYDVLDKSKAEQRGTRTILSWFADAYEGSLLGSHSNRWLADTYFVTGDFERAIQVARNTGLGLGDYLALAPYVDIRLTAGDVATWVESDTGLTATGMEMRSEIDEELQRVLDEYHDANGRSIVHDWWNRIYVHRESGTLPTITDNDVHGFTTDADIRRQIAWADDALAKARPGDYPPRAAFVSAGISAEIPWPGDYAYTTWYKKLMKARLQAVYRTAENRVREAKGLSRVGEGWVSEIALLNLVRDAFPNERVLHQGRPRWLKPQSLDIYLPDRHVAIEYQGIQHSQPVARFGGDEAFKSQRQRDERKRRLCAEHGCTLIEVHPDYDPVSVLARIQRAFADVI